MLVEWKYLLGLEASPSGGALGGLTVDPYVAGDELAPFDPRLDPFGARIISGTYSLQLPGGTALDLVLNAKERWHRDPQIVPLAEQALLWRAAAAAFHRLRPENRKSVAPLFDTADAIFPADAHRLPLAFLPGMKIMLERSFIETETRSIFAAAGDPLRADLLDLLRLSGAIGAWTQELRDLSGAELDEPTTQELLAAPAKLLPAAQLAVQSILNTHTTPAEQVNHGLALRLRDTDVTPPPPAVVGETLVTLIGLESSILNSPLLKERIIKIALWYGTDILANPKHDAWSAADVLWGLAALNALKAYDPSLDLWWLADGTAILREAASRLQIERAL